MHKGVGLEGIIYKNGVYKSEPHKVPLIARTFPWLSFYAQIISIILRASRLAKRGRYPTSEWAKSSIDVLRALESVGIEVEITGVEHFSALEGPCVFIGNHMSTLETFVLPVVVAQFKEVTFVVKQSLVETPFFKYVMRSRDPVTVGRTNPREDLRAVLEGGALRLERGTSIIVFPQTTRTPVFDPKSFNTIGIKLAKRANVPAVPIALKTDAWGNGKYLRDFGRVDPSKSVHFAFGEPLYISSQGAEEHQKVVEFIEGKLKEWGGSTVKSGALRSTPDN